MGRRDAGVLDGRGPGPDHDSRGGQGDQANGAFADRVGPREWRQFHQATVEVMEATEL